MVKLYYMPLSPPCRTVMLTAKALGIDLEFEKVDLFNGEHKTPEFLEINIQHSIPVMDDDGFVINESRAILCYLAEKYSKGDDDTLYPKDVQQRALIHQRLYFDMGTLYQRFINYYYPTIWTGAELDESKMPPLEEAFTFLDKFLEATPWVAGDNLTIADLAIVCSVNTCQVLGFDVSRYPNVSRWLENARETIEGYEEIEQEGLTMYKDAVDSLAAARGE